MDKFERHQQAQAPKRRKSRVKSGRRRDPGTTAKRKARVLVKVNKRVLDLEEEVRDLRARLAEIGKKGGVLSYVAGSDCDCDTDVGMAPCMACEARMTLKLVEGETKGEVER